jgi:hypothetical protein
MIRRLLAAAFVIALAVPAFAEDKFDAKKLKGNWLRDAGGTKLLYKFKDAGKMEARLTPQGQDTSVIVSVDYTVDKDGTVTGVITKIENGGDGPKQGDKFTMKVEVGKETLIVSDFKGVEGAEIKQLVEGEYKKQSD